MTWYLYIWEKDPEAKFVSLGMIFLGRTSRLYPSRIWESVLWSSGAGKVGTLPHGLWNASCCTLRSAAPTRIKSSARQDSGFELLQALESLSEIGGKRCVCKCERLPLGTWGSQPEGNWTLHCACRQQTWDYQLMQLLLVSAALSWDINALLARVWNAGKPLQAPNSPHFHGVPARL